MKNIVSVLLLLFLAQTAFAQTESNSHIEHLDYATLRVVYQFSQKATKNNVPVIITDTMALEIGDDWSKYYDLYRLRKDSIDVFLTLNSSTRGIRLSFDEEALAHKLESLQQPPIIIDKRANGESAILYKNKKTKQIMTIDDGPLEMPDTYTYLRFIENIPPQSWVIHNDTATIFQYSCQRATTTFRGRNYTAWFTMDIPIQEGPWKLYGLPGLILKAQDNENLFAYQIIGIEKLNSKPIVVESQRRWNTGNKLVLDYQFRHSDLKKWQMFRKQENKDIRIGFPSDDGYINYYNTKNPVRYIDQEI